MDSPARLDVCCCCCCCCCDGLLLKRSVVVERMLVRRYFVGIGDWQISAEEGGRDGYEGCRVQGEEDDEYERERVCDGGGEERNGSLCNGCVCCVCKLSLSSSSWISISDTLLRFSGEETVVVRGVFRGESCPSPVTPLNRSKNDIVFPSIPSPSSFSSWSSCPSTSSSIILAFAPFAGVDVADRLPTGRWQSRIFLSVCGVSSPLAFPFALPAHFVGVVMDPVNILPGKDETESNDDDEKEDEVSDLEFESTTIFSRMPASLAHRKKLQRLCPCPCPCPG